jgi:2,3-bisphosphoglycerate-dependent phosphoglycerate mutase
MAGNWELPNAERPLSEQGRKDARKLSCKLAQSGIDTIYSSPFKRALETVEPLSRETGIQIQIRNDLRESEKNEELPNVRKRMVTALREIVGENKNRTVVVCTHGGTTWGLISHFDSAFDHEQYKQIRTPDVRRFVYNEIGGRYDEDFGIQDL